MDWADEAIVLGARKHGETSAIVTLLTREHGRHAGLVRGGAGRRARGVYQPGNQVAARWRARLSEHLGTFTSELVRARAHLLLGDPLRLAALTSACAVAEVAVPERHPYPKLYEGLLALLDALQGDGESWGEAYVRWELGLLEELGYGLDLTRCAATGARTGLAYVSPSSGRAVSHAAGAPYRDKLLPLPRFLVGEGRGGARELAQGLTLTGHFFARHVFAAQGRGLPAARTRFIDRLSRIAPTSSGERRS
ncbi:MAG: DNA repair protein RecO [Alphaproteobacteria bacterium]